MGLDLNEESMKANGVNDQPTPIKLPQALGHAQLLSNFGVEHPSDFSIFRTDEKCNLMNELTKISISNISKEFLKQILFS